jgi:CheY-like chemotaxis protein
VSVSTLLRAELVHGGRTIIGHTMIVKPDRAFIRTDEAVDIGLSIEVKLSFRGTLAPTSFHGVVTAHREHAGPGEYAGIWVDIEPHTPADLATLHDVLDVRPPSRELRLLFVDDSSITRDVFSHFASAASSGTRLRVEAVADAEIAWTRLCDATYDLLMVDHFLPTTTGAELIARIRTEPRLATLPIIGLSVGGSVARDAMVSAGVDVFLDKPVRPRDVLDMLDRLPGLGAEVVS